MHEEWVLRVVPAPFYDFAAPHFFLSSTRHTKGYQTIQERALKPGDPEFFCWSTGR